MGVNLSAKYMRKVEDDLRGLPGSFNDLPITPLMHIGEMADSSAFDQLNKTTANALKGKRMRKVASRTAQHASRSARRAAQRVADAERRARAEQQRRIEARYTFPFPRYDLTCSVSTQSASKLAWKFLTNFPPTVISLAK